MNRDDVFRGIRIICFIIFAIYLYSHINHWILFVLGIFFVFPEKTIYAFEAGYFLLELRNKNLEEVIGMVLGIVGWGGVDIHLSEKNLGKGERFWKTNYLREE